jgi:hypothetical protein
MSARAGQTLPATMDTSNHVTGSLHRRSSVRKRLLLLVLALPTAAAASLSSPDSSANYSRNGTRILVMRSPDPEGDRALPMTLGDGRVVKIRDAFPKSGVYDARTLAPLWQVNWFAHDWDLEWSDDMRFVVERNRFGCRSRRALSFYADGKLTRTYSTGELLTGLNFEVLLPFTSGDWHTQWYDDFGADHYRSAVNVSTARRQLHFCGGTFDLARQEFYTFDLETGAMLTRRISGAWGVWVYGACALALLIAPPLVLRAIWRRWRSRRANGQRGFEVVGV